MLKKQHHSRDDKDSKHLINSDSLGTIQHPDTSKKQYPEKILEDLFDKSKSWKEICHKAYDKGFSDGQNDLINALKLMEVPEYDRIQEALKKLRGRK